MILLALLGCLQILLQANVRGKVVLASSDLEIDGESSDLDMVGESSDVISNLERRISSLASAWPNSDSHWADVPGSWTEFGKYKRQVDPTSSGSEAPGYSSPNTEYTGYPNQPTQNGYQTNQAGYPGSQAGYPGSQAEYLGSQAGYQGGSPAYTSGQHGYQSSQPGYQNSQPTFQPSQSFQSSQPGYPNAQSGFPIAQTGFYTPPVYSANQPGPDTIQLGYRGGFGNQPAALQAPNPSFASNPFPNQPQQTPGYGNSFDTRNQNGLGYPLNNELGGVADPAGFGQRVNSFPGKERALPGFRSGYQPPQQNSVSQNDDFMKFDSDSEEEDMLKPPQHAPGFGANGNRFSEPNHQFYQPNLKQQPQQFQPQQSGGFNSLQQPSQHQQQQNQYQPLQQQQRPQLHQQQQHHHNQQQQQQRVLLPPVTGFNQQKQGAPGQGNQNYQVINYPIQPNGVSAPGPRAPGPPFQRPRFQRGSGAPFPPPGQERPPAFPPPGPENRPPFQPQGPRPNGLFRPGPGRPPRGPLPGQGNLNPQGRGPKPHLPDLVSGNPFAEGETLDMDKDVGDTGFSSPDQAPFLGENPPGISPNQVDEFSEYPEEYPDYKLGSETPGQGGEEYDYPEPQENKDRPAPNSFPSDKSPFKDNFLNKFQEGTNGSDVSDKLVVDPYSAKGNKDFDPEEFQFDYEPGNKFNGDQSEPERFAGKGDKDSREKFEKFADFSSNGSKDDFEFGEEEKKFFASMEGNGYKPDADFEYDRNDFGGFEKFSEYEYGNEPDGFDVGGRGAGGAGGGAGGRGGSDFFDKQGLAKNNGEEKNGGVAEKTNDQGYRPTFPGEEEETWGAEQTQEPGDRTGIKDQNENNTRPKKYHKKNETKREWQEDQPEESGNMKGKYKGREGRRVMNKPRMNRDEERGGQEESRKREESMEKLNPGQQPWIPMVSKQS